MKKAIISVLLGKYDTLKPAPKYKGWDAILFTDTHYPNSLGWTIHKVKSDNPLHDSRYYKWLTHQILPMYNLFCYMDASMELIGNPPEKTTWFKHPLRRSVKNEATAIKKLVKAPNQLVDAQLSEYKNQGFTDKNGLYQNGFFVRENSFEINHLCETVYNITSIFTNRDQLALPFALFQTNIKLKNVLPGRHVGQYIRIHPHNKTKHTTKNQELKTLKTNYPKVHHITPGRSDKNFGKSINDIVKLLPETDWICLRDIDTMPAYHEKFFKQCEEIAENGNYGLVGCITNRLGLRYQLHNNQLSNNTDWMHHRAIAKNRYMDHKSIVEPTNQIIAGLFMLFPKSVWKAVKGFPEGSIMIDGAFLDFHFSTAVKKAGFKLGIANGIYLIHMYRPDAKVPRIETNHLI